MVFRFCYFESAYIPNVSGIVFTRLRGKCGVAALYPSSTRVVRAIRAGRGWIGPDQCHFRLALISIRPPRSRFLKARLEPSGENSKPTRAFRQTFADKRQMAPNPTPLYTFFASTYAHFPFLLPFFAFDVDWVFRRLLLKGVLVKGVLIFRLYWLKAFSCVG